MHPRAVYHAGSVLACHLPLTITHEQSIISQLSAGDTTRDATVLKDWGSKPARLEDLLCILLGERLGL